MSHDKVNNRLHLLDCLGGFELQVFPGKMYLHMAA